MSTPAPRPPRPKIRGAGGPFVLLLIVATCTGFLLGEATIGFLIGTGLGLALILALWLADRRG